MWPFGFRMSEMVLGVVYFESISTFTSNQMLQIFDVSFCGGEKRSSIWQRTNTSLCLHKITT